MERKIPNKQLTVIISDSCAFLHSGAQDPMKYRTVHIELTESQKEQLILKSDYEDYSMCFLEDKTQ